MIVSSELCFGNSYFYTPCYCFTSLAKAFILEKPYMQGVGVSPHGKILYILRPPPSGDSGQMDICVMVHISTTIPNHGLYDISQSNFMFNEVNRQPNKSILLTATFFLSRYYYVDF